MLCAAAVTAQFVAGKAARDALYLANLGVTALPVMVVASAVVDRPGRRLVQSAEARGARHVRPGALPSAPSSCSWMGLGYVAPK